MGRRRKTYSEEISTEDTIVSEDEVTKEETTESNEPENTTDVVQEEITDNSQEEVIVEDKPQDLDTSNRNCITVSSDNPIRNVLTPTSEVDSIISNRIVKTIDIYDKVTLDIPETEYDKWYDYYKSLSKLGLIIHE